MPYKYLLPILTLLALVGFAALFFATGFITVSMVKQMPVAFMGFGAFAIGIIITAAILGAGCDKLDALPDLID